MWFTDEFDFDTYEGHRFCEEGKETLDDPDIWFFTINGNDSPSTIRRRAPTTPRTGDHGNFTTYAPEAVIKAFHPKTAAFTVIKDQLREAIGQLGTPRELHTAQGQLQCQPAHDVGDEKWYATRDDMVQAVGEFCDSTAAAGVNPGYLESVHNGQIVSAGWNDDASDCPEIDVTADSFPTTCKERLMVPVDGCK